jgi:hypothetical protein
VLRIVCTDYSLHFPVFNLRILPQKNKYGFSPSFRHVPLQSLNFRTSLRTLPHILHIFPPPIGVPSVSFMLRMCTFPPNTSTLLHSHLEAFLCARNPSPLVSRTSDSARTYHHHREIRCHQLDITDRGHRPLTSVPQATRVIDAYGCQDRLQGQACTRLLHNRCVARGKENIKDVAHQA